MSVPSLPHDAPSVDALRSAVDAMDALVTLLDPEGRVLHVNHAWRVAVATGEVPATGPARLVGDGALDPAVAAGVREVLDGRRAAFEAEQRHGPPGGERWLALRAMPIAVDGVGAIVVHTDVTARHAAEHHANDDDGRDRTTGLVTRRRLDRRLAGLLRSGPVGVVAVHVVVAPGGGAADVVAPPGPADAVLRETVELLRRLLGPEAVLGRYDADVLVVLLPGTDAAALRTTALAVEAGWRSRLGARGGLAVVVGSWPAAPGGDARHALARAVAGARAVAVTDARPPAVAADDATAWDDGLSPARRPASASASRPASRSDDGALPRSPAAPRPPAHA